MRTIRIILTGGPFCGLTFNTCPADAWALIYQGRCYARSERRCPENRQVFLLAPETARSRIRNAHQLG